MSDGWCSMMIKGGSFIKSPPVKCTFAKKKYEKQTCQTSTFNSNI